MRRRDFLKLAAIAPGIIQRDRPVIDAGVSAGPAGAGRVIVWAHVDRPSRMTVEYSTTASFNNARRVPGTLATSETGLTARALIEGLPSGQDLFYRVRFEDARDPRVSSAPEQGHLRTTPAQGRPVRVVWSADVCGQGWGIDVARGGMKLFETMRNENPDLFVHVGDTIYADAPLREQVRLDDGSTWRNIVTPAKSRVAETIDDYRGNHLYNRLDEHYRRFAAEVGAVVMWDDHEVRDNWYPSQIIPENAPTQYQERRIAVLAARARQAFLESYPIAMDTGADALIYRRIDLGPLIDVFALDMRSYRGANSGNMQGSISADTAFLGSRQAQWLADALARSSAAWKVVAADMPLGLVVSHRPGEHEAVANADAGPPLGRELEIAGLLRSLKERRVKNVVWITADVHYCAAHYYDPARAAAADFDPFWEFVAGPAHAGTFSPPPFDMTFGPEMRFCGVPSDLEPNRPPSDGLQFFGLLEADPRTRSLVVSLINTGGQRIFRQELEPV